MTDPLPLPAPLKSIARALRDTPFSNRLLSSAARRLPQSNLRRRLIARLPRIGQVSARLPDGKTMWMESRSSESVTTSIYYDGWMGQEPEVLPIWRELAQQAAVVLDIGSHVGHFSVVAGRTNPSARFHCFEPLPRVAALLRRNLDLNGIKADVHQLALGRRPGHLTFYAVPEGIPSSSSLSKAFMSEEHGSRLDEIPVTVSSLDEMFPDLSGPTLIKIDTETTEPDVLGGGHLFLTRVKPIIVVEVLDRHETGPALQLELDRAGCRYTPYLMTGTGLVETQAIRGDSRWRNFLLVPDGGPYMTPEVADLIGKHKAR